MNAAPQQKPNVKLTPVGVKNFKSEEGKTSNSSSQKIEGSQIDSRSYPNEVPSTMTKGE